MLLIVEAPAWALLLFWVRILGWGERDERAPIAESVFVPWTHRPRSSARDGTF